ncbi:Uncharacterized conserved protein, DUF362 family [Desulfatibacillum alkenivorans DSM 16219]|uniref:Uncharacterized conserved protein, DUF362 family n=1 Tax=Desulfatibacillum alkenivorans DSM 16219 TaxID=1121393 RepID=A0A1M6R7P9_9BACT|nr:DUF362 domain-containing protein [Desulfatibacillum alkenivorans]SHK28348.1 Uncharacterized conserved protein, DUF362 family [Desulfatibacillum alkenivorans DSM 16219]
MAGCPVSVLKCQDYSPENLRNTIMQSLENIGFDPQTFQGARVALKPNLLVPAPPEKAVITHHEFFRAAARIVKEYGGAPVLIESPSIHSTDRVIKKTAYAQVVAEEGVEVANVDHTRALNYEGSRRYKHVDVAEAFFNADVIINLPKFKTHGLTYVTGAVKNMFGAIPGLQKSKMHVKAPAADEFSEFLLDLYGCLLYGFDKPKTFLHLMDGIIVMEGEGPGASGSPARMDAVLASTDAVALDYVATTLSGLDVEKALITMRGFERGFNVSSPEEVQWIGDPRESFTHNPLRPSRGTILSNMVRWPITSKRFRNLFIDRPVPGREKCTLCYQCMKICPAGAISKAKPGAEKPTYDYNKCIRCYCCMEVCPEAAIEKGRGRLQWLLRM